MSEGLADGCEVVAVGSGAELRCQLERLDGNGRLQVVVCDLRASGRASLDVLLALRRLSWTIPRILITTPHQRPHAATGVTGAALVLDGPDCASELRAAVRRLAGRS